MMEVLSQAVGNVHTGTTQFPKNHFRSFRTICKESNFRECRGAMKQSDGTEVFYDDRNKLGYGKPLAPDSCDSAVGDCS